MSRFERDPDNDTGNQGCSGASKGTSEPEILFDRPTKQRPPQEVLRYGITEAILDGETALFDVLPSLGKSRSVAVAAKTHIPVSVFTNLEDNYEQFEDWSQEFGVRFDKFPVSVKDCPTLHGDYADDETAAAAMEAKKNGWPVGVLHRKYNLPCQQSGTCEYIEKVRDLDVDGSGILAGHYTQAYVESYVKNRVVVLDEDAFEQFYETIRNPVQEAQKFIDTLDDFPFENARRPEVGEDEKQKKALNRLEEVGLGSEEHTESTGEFHAKAPLLAYAIFGAKKLDNGLKYIELPENGAAVFDSLHPRQEGDYDDGTPTIWLLNPPDFSEADAVIGLDATPCLPKWECILGEDVNHYRLFDDDDRSQYLREQGYEFVQLNSHAWPAQGGNLSITKCEAYLREVYRKHDIRPDLITSQDVLAKLEDEELDHLWDKNLHFGDLRGKNNLKNSELLVVLGSPSRSDDFYEHLTALFGENAKRNEDTQGVNLSYGNPVADELLDTTRRGGVFQAAMRAGREEETEATIYVATGLVPDWLNTKQVGQRLPSGGFDACPNPRSSGEREVIEALHGAEGISTSELVKRVKIGREAVNNHRKALQDQGLIQKEGERRWANYSDDGLERLNIAGEVDLSLSGNTPIKNSIRGKYPIESSPEPRRQLPDSPLDRYPDWMRGVQRKVSERKLDEQLKQRWRSQ